MGFCGILMGFSETFWDSWGFFEMLMHSLGFQRILRDSQGFSAMLPTLRRANWPISQTE